MKRQIIIAALCAALQCPVVNAEDVTIGNVLTDDEIWDGLMVHCDEEENNKDRAECKSIFRDLKVVSKKPARKIAKSMIDLLKKYDECDEEDQKKYGLSREACWQHITEKAPDCERLYLQKIRPTIGNILDFLMCLAPNRACDDANTRADKAWREHCNELDWDGNG